jgi:hypothetical protein
MVLIEHPWAFSAVFILLSFALISFAIAHMISDRLETMVSLKNMLNL